MRSGPRIGAAAVLLLGAAVSASFYLDRDGARVPADDPRLTLEGTVGSIDRATRSFVLHTPNGGHVTAHVPIGAPLPARLRYRQLRSDDFVRVKGRFDADGVFLIEQFLLVRRGGIEATV